jgi:DNA-binding response OmpR family regulator
MQKDAETIKQTTLLIIDDDPSILDMVVEVLRSENYRLLTAQNAESGLRQCEQELPELIICDVNLPDMSGIDLCRIVKNHYPQVLFMFLSGIDDEVDKVLGLELGAEDYVTKPISVREFKARVRAILRRLHIQPRHTSPAAPPQERQTLRCKDMEIDLHFCQVRLYGQEVDLTKKEYEILALLATHPGQVFSREHILNQIWMNDMQISDRSIDAHIRRLRDKIEENTDKPYYIETVRGFGYRFRAKNTAP